MNYSEYPYLIVGGMIEDRFGVYRYIHSFRMYKHFGLKMDQCAFIGEQEWKHQKERILSENPDIIIKTTKDLQKIIKERGVEL